jgi:predicted Fe-S protein YdhL (DUF1289 family)|nr:MAG TPA: Transcription factor S-II (TFIIS) [Caudoviricetes sp.]
MNVNIENVDYCPFCDKYSVMFDKCMSCQRPLLSLTFWNTLTEEQREEMKKKLENDGKGPHKRITWREEQDEFDAKFRKEYTMPPAPTEPVKKPEPEPEKTVYIPKCPVCGSPDLRKISATSKVLDVAFWGFAAGKPKKTYHCNNCDYEF